MNPYDFSRSGHPDASSNGEAARAKRTPRWETVVLASSFVFLWIWFAQRQSVTRAGETLDLLWWIALLAVLVVVVVIFVRRLNRFTAALRELRARQR